MFEYFCEQRRPRRGRLAKEQVEKLPSRKYKKGTWAVWVKSTICHRSICIFKPFTVVMYHRGFY